MSIKLMNLVWEADNSNLSGIEKAILLRMADFAADDGTSIYPSIGRLEKDTGFKARSIKYSIADLEKKNILVIVRSYGLLNHYFINVRELTNLKTPGHLVHQCITCTSAPDAPNQSINISYRKILSNNDSDLREIQDPARESENGVKIVQEDAFESFWDKYPVKKARQKAKEAFSKGKCHLSLGLILKSLESQILEREHREHLGLFTPEWAHATTWLNQKRWEDEIVPLQKLQSQSAKSKISKMSERDRANMKGMVEGQKAIQRIQARAKQIEAEALR